MSNTAGYSPNIISSAPQPPDETQLDRIEWKLDQLLARPYWIPPLVPPQQDAGEYKRTTGTGTLRPPTDPFGVPVAY